MGSARERRGGSISGGSRADDGSLEGLQKLLNLSLELVANGEKRATSNTAAILEMSEWIVTLEQKQLVRGRFCLLLFYCPGIVRSHRERES